MYAADLPVSTSAPHSLSFLSLQTLSALFYSFARRHQTSKRTAAEGEEEDQQQPEASAAQLCGDAADVDCQAGSAERPEVQVRSQPVMMGNVHALRRSHHGSHGRCDVMGVEIFERLPELGMPQTAPEARSPGDREPELNSLIGTTCDWRGAPEAALENSQNTRILTREDMQSANRKAVVLRSIEEEEVKGDLKFSYFVTGIAGAGIFGVYSGYLGNPTGQVHSIYFQLCTILLMAAFASGVGLMLLSLRHPCFQAAIQIIKALKYTSFGCLTLAIIDVCIIFLGAYVALAFMLAFIPTMLVMVIRFTMVLCNDGLQQTHRVNSSTQEENKLMHLISIVCE